MRTPLPTYEVFVGESLPDLSLFLRENTQLISGLDSGHSFRLRVVPVEGGAVDGKACRGWCSYDSLLPGFACSDAADCVTGTCINSALCPTSGQQCDTASKSPAGTGKINIIDALGSAGVVVDGLRVNDHMNGKGVQVGVRSAVRNVNLNAPSGNTWTQPYTVLAGTYYPLVTSFGVTNGIVAGWGSEVRNNSVRATVTGIELQTAFGYAFTTDLFYRQSVVSNNLVNISADSATGLLVNSPAQVRDNRVIMTGDYDFGIKLGAAADGSHVAGNNVGTRGTREPTLLDRPPGPRGRRSQHVRLAP